VKVYRSMRAGFPPHRLMVQPGNEYPDGPEEWYVLTSTSTLYGGGKPVRSAASIVVTFTDGEAEVTDRLGKYLLEKELAFKTRQPTLPAPGESAA
jgi:hypothetical protein